MGAKERKAIEALNGRARALAAARRERMSALIEGRESADWAKWQSRQRVPEAEPVGSLLAVLRRVLRLT
jgi:hypothetical protein